MAIAIKSIIARAFCGALCIAAAACSPRHIPVVSVTDMMDDRVLLDGVLMKCNRDPGKARSDVECLNARVAIERLASRADPVKEAKRIEDFERSREQLRLTQEKQRQEQESKTKVDAYHLPLVPVEPSPAPKDPQSPIVGQTSR